MTALNDPVKPRRVMFVDDDLSILDGLRDALWTHRRRWTMTFVGSAAEAIATLDHEYQDVVISDLRMPGMDGVTLLDHVRRHSPGAVRIVLSGHAEVSTIAHAATIAHRLVAKPCETRDLVEAIERSCALQDLSDRVRCHSRALRTASLPSVPRLFWELSDLLQSGSATTSEIAGVISQDLAMGAKVLQLANSAYFGRRTPVADIGEAIAYVGTDMLRALLLQAEAFSAFALDAPVPGFDLDALHRHSQRVGWLAQRLLRDVGGRGDAFMAGLLHDVGLLVLAAQTPDELTATLTQAYIEGCALSDCERSRQGVSHAEVGAHLLDLWGLPHSLVEAVAAHDDPSWLRLPFDVTAAVHVANALIETCEGRPPSARADELEAYLLSAEVGPLRERWRTLARDLCA